MCMCAEIFQKYYIKVKYLKIFIFFKILNNHELIIELYTCLCANNKIFKKTDRDRKQEGKLVINYNLDMFK